MDSEDRDAALILGIGGGMGEASSTTRALTIALSEAERYGARTVLLDGRELSRLALYQASGAASQPAARALVEQLRRAAGVIIASPAFHGTVSGLLKNSIDYIEETAQDARPYLTDMPVGLITIAGGHQAAGSTLTTLRTIVHALRGWPTPFGAAINSNEMRFVDGRCADDATVVQLRRVGEQVATFVLHGPGGRRGPTDICVPLRGSDSAHHRVMEQGA